ncbi:hypothetical protein HYH02_014423 [Chlamydomonas schloesseri]|uniref:Large ribosomal subunit protein uL30m n=1 Tax=Chlamydomonas schloesseri TaxID=2026947 RepID=A0A835SYI0_9CHLO|nr:hypothetical protein HYH02_014423 [Chlamydomonas schloesseri]|eukprot:KAG2428241.1 hypothetical protein HYH02_014423 [Chlamydomonas schloesseri]
MATEGSAQVVKSLFVTLRRGFAGTPWFHRRVLESLGLKYRHQCVEKPNNSSIRGMLSKVPHLVIIETDRMRHLRELKEHYQQLPREPWVLHHDPPLLPPAAAAAAAAAAPASGSAAPADSSFLDGAALPAPVPPALPAQPRLTPFAASQLREHVEPVGLEGYRANRQPPLPPRKYFVEQSRRWRAKVLTERGVFSADACREHAEAIRPKAYRRRTGIRD